tara:strand:- start:1528 stop:2841 length:1314 start_codon:yes stop_codon:yes gene_type:complete
MKVKEIMERAGINQTGRAIAYIKDGLEEMNMYSSINVKKGSKSEVLLKSNTLKFAPHIKSASHQDPLDIGALGSGIMPRNSDFGWAGGTAFPTYVDRNNPPSGFFRFNYIPVNATGDVGNGTDYQGYISSGTDLQWRVDGVGGVFGVGYKVSNLVVGDNYLWEFDSTLSIANTNAYATISTYKGASSDAAGQTAWWYTPWEADNQQYQTEVICAKAITAGDNAHSSFSPQTFGSKPIDGQLSTPLDQKGSIIPIGKTSDTIENKWGFKATASEHYFFVWMHNAGTTCKFTLDNWRISPILTEVTDTSSASSFSQFESGSKLTIENSVGIDSNSDNTFSNGYYNVHGASSDGTKLYLGGTASSNNLSTFIENSSNNIILKGVGNKYIDIVKNKRFYDLPEEVVRVLDVKVKHHLNETDKRRSIPRFIGRPTITDEDNL